MFSAKMTAQRQAVCVLNMIWFYRRKKKVMEGSGHVKPCIFCYWLKNKQVMCFIWHWMWVIIIIQNAKMCGVR